MRTPIKSLTGAAAILLLGTVLAACSSSSTTNTTAPGSSASVPSIAAGDFTSDFAVMDQLKGLASQGTGLIGVQVANLCNLLNPRRVIIGGSLSAAGDILLDPIRASIERCALPMAAATAEVVAGELGDRATVLGALSLVFRQVDPFELKPRRGPVPVARIQPAVTQVVDTGTSGRSSSV